MKTQFFAVDEKGRKHAFLVKQEENHLYLTLPKEALANVEKLSALGDFSRAEAGDEGYYLMPRTIRMMGEFQTFFTPREDVTYTYDRGPVMSMLGLKKKGLCCLVRLERTYKYKLQVNVADNIYSFSVNFDFTQNDPVYDDIRLEIVMLPDTADYPEMAKCERELRLARGEITPLSEKCKREAVEYGRKYPLIRIRMGWKPVPSPVKHQTPETEPEMFVACSFERVCEIADELERQGVEGAELQLVGWNIGGHDGRPPQYFPADPRLGGDEGLKKAIDYVKSKGYRISLHTNVLDAYEIADCFSWDYIIIGRNGDYMQLGDWGGGLSYNVCPEQQLKHAEMHLEKLLPLGLNGMHYIDVISIVEPRECLSEKHPVNTRDAVKIMQNIQAVTREAMGAFSSEGAMDFALGDLDYALYLTFGESFGAQSIPFADRYLPFWELTYHGIILYNPTSATINYPIKTTGDKLIAMLRGGKPSLYFFSKFVTGVGINWMGTNDLVTTTDDDLRHAVSAVKEALDEYQITGLDRLQNVYMSDYKVFDNGIEAAIYEDGTTIVGNFGEAAAQYGDLTVEAGEYKVIKL